MYKNRVPENRMLSKHSNINFNAPQEKFSKFTLNASLTHPHFIHFCHYNNGKSVNDLIIIRIRSRDFHKLRKSDLSYNKNLMISSHITK